MNGHTYDSDTAEQARTFAANTIFDLKRVRAGALVDQADERAVFQNLSVVVGDRFAAQADYTLTTARCAPLHTIPAPLRALAFGILAAEKIDTPAHFAAALRSVSGTLADLADGNQPADEVIDATINILRRAADALDTDPQHVDLDDLCRRAPAEQRPRTQPGPLDLDALAGDVGAHLDHLGIARDDWVRIAKTAEEAGEVLGALSKRAQNRATTQDILDELGDVFLAAVGAADQLGVSPTRLILDRWATVSRRLPAAAPAGPACAAFSEDQNPTP